MEVFRPGHEILGLDRPEIDITDLEQCLSIAEGFRTEVILNAAAFTRVDECETHQREAFLVNGEGAGNLCRAAAAVGSRMVHYSTDYVFDGIKREAYLEEDLPNPQSIYGKSKLLGEDLVRRHCPDHLILRTSWLFGRHGVNFIRTIVSAAQKGSPLRVVDDQRGSPTYSKDLASQTLRMVNACCRRTYHVTNSGTCTWFELASQALECAAIHTVLIAPVSTLEFPRAAPRPANSILANARLQREGFRLMRPWQEAVREYVKEEFRIERA